MKVIDTKIYLDTMITLVKEGQSVVIPVVGHSMEPFVIHERDQFILTPLVRELQKGDLALFRRMNGDYILHRVIRVDEEGYYFVGDNQNLCDIEGPIKKNEICAAVYQVIRKNEIIDEKHLIWKFFQYTWITLINQRRALKRIPGIKYIAKFALRKRVRACKK